MEHKKYPPTRDRRNIGQVVFPMETMMAARELSSCCVGTEALLETNAGCSGFLKQEAGRKQFRRIFTRSG